MPPLEGQILELGAELPPFPAPARYRVQVDLVDELVTTFRNMGSQPLVFEVEAVAPPVAGLAP